MYFIEDYEVLDVTTAELRRPDMKAMWARVRRPDFLTMDFKYEDEDGDYDYPKGKYVITKMGTGKNINKYVCRYTGKQGGTKRYFFDVGYCQKVLIKEIFPPVLLKNDK